MRKRGYHSLSGGHSHIITPLKQIPLCELIEARREGFLIDPVLPEKRPRQVLLSAIGQLAFPQREGCKANRYVVLRRRIGTQRKSF